MALKLELSEFPIDTSRGGELKVAPEFMTALLNLRAGQAVVGMRVTPDGCLALTVCGTGMLPLDHKLRPQQVVLTLRDERRGVIGRGTEARTVAAWAHAPKIMWTLSEWSLVSDQLEPPIGGSQATNDELPAGNNVLPESHG
jgi:hypothetical protein